MLVTSGLACCGNFGVDFGLDSLQALGAQAGCELCSLHLDICAQARHSASLPRPPHARQYPHLQAHTSAHVRDARVSNEAARARALVPLRGLAH